MLDIGPEQTGGHRIDISTTNGLPEVLSRLALELTRHTSGSVPLCTTVGCGTAPPFQRTVP